MGGKHRDPLRPLTAGIIGLVVMVGVTLLACYWADYPAGFWSR